MGPVWRGNSTSTGTSTCEVDLESERVQTNGGFQVIWRNFRWFMISNWCHTLTWFRKLKIIHSQLSSQDQATSNIRRLQASWCLQVQTTKSTTQSSYWLYRNESLNFTDRTHQEMWSQFMKTFIVPFMGSCDEKLSPNLVTGDLYFTLYRVLPQKTEILVTLWRPVRSFYFTRNVDENAERLHPLTFFQSAHWATLPSIDAGWALGNLVNFQAFHLLAWWKIILLAWTTRLKKFFGVKHKTREGNHHLT